MPKYTQEKFIEKAIAKHSNKYLYDKAIYSGTNNSIIIICPVHGEFETTPYNHFRGGCANCAQNYYNTESFITKAKTINDNAVKFSYDKVSYINSYTKITITCLVHGDWEQDPSSHLQGHGCPVCSPIRRLFGHKFIKPIPKINKEEAPKIYQKYYPPKFVKENKAEMIKVTPVKDNQKSITYEIPELIKICADPTKEFIRVAKLVKSNSTRYTYDKVVYKNKNSPVIITCIEHGDFLQTPIYHLKGNGCKRLMHMTWNKNNGS